jgi:hypothetical protein
MAAKVITPVQRRKRRPPDPPGPSAQNTRKDAQVEENLRAMGGDPTLSPPGSMKPEQRELEEIEQYIAGDGTLSRQPQVRRLLREVSMEQACNLDGTPLMIGPEGKQRQIPGTWWKVLWRAGFLKAIQGDQEWAERIWLTLFGKPREAMELSGAGGGPIQISEAPTDPAELTKMITGSLRVLSEYAVGDKQDLPEPLEVRSIRAPEAPPVLEAQIVPVGAPGGVPGGIPGGIPPSMPGGVPGGRSQIPVPPFVGSVKIR